MMKVEIWSDLICPWCGIGQHRLEQALAAFPHRDQVQVVHRSFQLDENAPTTPEPARTMLARKYRMDAASVAAAQARVEGIAKADGIAPYIVGDNLVGNTRLAHELLAFARDRGLEAAAWHRLYRAYFGEARSIFDEDALVALAAELGLPADEARAVLRDGRYRAQVEADAREARELGSTGVPFVVIDRRYGIAGAQPVEAFREALAQAWREHAGTVQMTGDADASCGPDGCAV